MPKYLLVQNFANFLLEAITVESPYNMPPILIQIFN